MGRGLARELQLVGGSVLTVEVGICEVLVSMSRVRPGSPRRL